MLIWDRTALVCVAQNIEMFAMLAMEESNQGLPLRMSINRCSTAIFILYDTYHNLEKLSPKLNEPEHLLAPLERDSKTI